MFIVRIWRILGLEDFVAQKCLDEDWRDKD